MINSALGQSPCTVSWPSYLDWELGNRARWVSWWWNSPHIPWNSILLSPCHVSKVKVFNVMKPSMKLQLRLVRGRSCAATAGGKGWVGKWKGPRRRRWCSDYKENRAATMPSLLPSHGHNAAGWMKNKSKPYSSRDYSPLNHLLQLYYSKHYSNLYQFTILPLIK